MRKIVAPLALLASISLLTSCTKKEEAPMVTPTATETPAPVMNDVTPTPATPTPTPTTTDTPTPSVSPEDTSVASSGATTPETAPQTVAPISRTETVKYNTPGGGDVIEFSVTVTDGVITAATANVKAENEISKKFQESFAPKLSESVVGKKAKDLNVTAIGGASLATNAFVTFANSF